MHTLFDFVTHVKTVEYLIAVSAIAGFIIFWELLKPRPFKAVVEHGREDLEYIKKTGYGNTMKALGKVAAAPFIGLAYIVALPFMFVFMLSIAALSGVTRALGVSASFGWRPQEAYLTGRKEDKKDTEEEKKKED
jgi:hypothetical protein